MSVQPLCLTPRNRTQILQLVTEFNNGIAQVKTVDCLCSFMADEWDVTYVVWFSGLWRALSSGWEPTFQMTALCLSEYISSCHTVEHCPCRKVTPSSVFESAALFIVDLLSVCIRSVSQDLSETILTMVGNCSILLTKPRQPPPGVLRHRGIEPAFNPSSLGGQVSK